ncbi:hypothetical protein [Algoriphagus zhangzhouensis]|uniref:PAS domain S-box-containing protein n=1 Tax=Algoriphagus zhangzhouensis TaxID=1073327 RepID=A0A1M7ZHJ6_9BACT|nr:hypothetical protein [Algoriphagus zhangzhouensis]TDY44183.1 hypothetical protein A8938_3395 [Algoriphagus zhangzhouensis]SHO64347.1 hypothetical protein SAMN04488108_3391 [Algoriphagus zhangzhouensis]
MISISNIDQLIPEYLRESEHFFLVCLDIEGNVTDCNALFQRAISIKEGNSILSALNQGFRNEFEGLMDQIIHYPSKSHQVILDFGTSKPISSSWEFTMLINQEMDPVGFIGIGVELSLLEGKLSWGNLLEVFSLGKADLDENLRFRSADDQILNWLNIDSETLISKNLFEVQTLELNLLDQLKLKEINQLKDFYHFSLDVTSGSHQGKFSINLLRHSKGFLLLMRQMNQLVKEEIFSKPFTDFQIEAFSGPVWILERDTRIVQQNSYAEGVSEKWLKKLANEGDFFDLKFANEKSDRFLELIGDAFEGNEKDLNLQIKTKNGSNEYWTFQVKPLKVNADKVYVMVYAIDMTAVNSKLVKMEGELETLRELALCPSHILRSPLSSMLGLLELIDFRKLDPENQRYISYLKPLAQELDDVIRSNAKKMAAFD